MRQDYVAAPEWVNDGDTVLLPLRYNDATGVVTCIVCKVAVAMGDLARVVSEKRGINKWVLLSELLVRPGDMRHPSNRGKVAALVDAVVRAG